MMAFVNPLPDIGKTLKRVFAVLLFKEEKEPENPRIIKFVFDSLYLCSNPVYISLLRIKKRAEVQKKSPLEALLLGNHLFKHSYRNKCILLITCYDLSHGSVQQ